MKIKHEQKKLSPWSFHSRQAVLTAAGGHHCILGCLPGSTAKMTAFYIRHDNNHLFGYTERRNNPVG
jgi:hypothetical protein